MPKFKVGDEVRVVNPTYTYHFLQDGSVGKVLSVAGTYKVKGVNRSGSPSTQFLLDEHVRPLVTVPDTEAFFDD